MENMSIHFNLGAMEAPGGKMEFTFDVYSNGDGHLQIYAFDPDDLRKSGVFFRLGQFQYDRLKEIIANTDDVIDKLSRGGQLKRLMAGWQP